MTLLKDDLSTLKKLNALEKVPTYITTNLNPNFKLREYQTEAFQRFITYFYHKELRQQPSRTLFHMATGSGKTLIMAGLILFLYQEGYRNFLFFVNSSNILEKTKDNFLNTLSNKYLFNKCININGENISIIDVANFQESDPNAINICFCTIQGLHLSLNYPKENEVSYDDFTDKKIVFISDEAHHINAETKKGKPSSSDESWEYTVESLFHTNNKNVLLEFTATLDISNSYIKAKYDNYIIFEYLLTQFREDKYSKDVQILQTELDPMNRAILAICINQYRLKMFNKYGYNIKPVVLFKSKRIADSIAFQENFLQTLADLTPEYLDTLLSTLKDSDELVTSKLKNYLQSEDISTQNFLLELKHDFSSDFCINVNKDEDLVRNQIILNSLEDSNNPYRAIFAVDKLNEGWDVLNLFDIIRLYNTRDADHANGKIGATTMSEAQLIGRGARYCPFTYEFPDNKYIRKFDNDLNHDLRVCEELYYHSQQNSRYIQELRTALRETGIMADSKKVTLTLKDSFMETELYKTGVVYVNDKQEVSRAHVTGLNPKSRNRNYNINLTTNNIELDNLITENLNTITEKSTVNHFKVNFIDLGFPIIYKALRKFTIFSFKILKEFFPNINSIIEFIQSPNYLGGIIVNVSTAKSSFDELDTSDKMTICMNILNQISIDLISEEKAYKGTCTFHGLQLSSMMKPKKVLTFSKVSTDGSGVAQSEVNNSDLKMDLSDKNWYAYTDNYGTDQEKLLVKYFSPVYDELIKVYDEVYLIRNERIFHVYSFKDGNRFEPDFILFLKKDKASKAEVYQVFIEPKGTQLLERDAWKEEFMLELNEMQLSINKPIYEDSNIIILGMPFYNSDDSKNFDEKLHELLLPELDEYYVEEIAPALDPNL